MVVEAFIHALGMRALLGMRARTAFTETQLVRVSPTDCTLFYFYVAYPTPELSVPIS